MKTQKIKFIMLLFFGIVSAETAFSQVRVNVNVGRPYHSHRYGYNRPYRQGFYRQGFYRPVPPPAYYGGPVYFAPRPFYIAPPPIQRVWVPGYWTYNRRGYQVWINGYWRVF